MSVSQNFGVLRVVRVQNAGLVGSTKKLRRRHAKNWLPEDRWVHLLTRRETTIGRALTCDLVLMDPTVSREHARLVLSERGWQLYNLTESNIVCVNGEAVAGNSSLPVQPQDLVLLGGTVLQLIAPDIFATEDLPVAAGMPDCLQMTSPLHSFIDDAAKLTLEDEPLPASGLSSLSEAVSKSFPIKKETLARSGEALEDADISPYIAEDDEGVMGGVTMQFMVPQQLQARVRWSIVAFMLLVALVGACVVVVLHSIGDLSALVQNGPLAVLATLTIPLIPAVGISLLVNFIDRFEREPWFLRLAAFLWGAIIAIPPALFIEQRFDYFASLLLGPDANALMHAIFQGLGAGITEETIKGLGLLLLFLVLRDEFDNVTDGIVYGALIGAGFAMVENFFYFAENPKLLLFLVISRIVLGWLCHSTFTVCFGAALGYMRHTNVHWKQIVVPLVGYLAAVGLHSIFDFVNQFANDLYIASPDNATISTFSIIAIVANYIPPFLTQIGIIYILLRSLRHEVAIIREFLAAEVSHGVVSVDEYALLQHSFVRTRAERGVLLCYGWKQWWRVKELYQTEIGLAFRKWHVSMGDKPKLGFLQPEDAYRSRIRRLRKEIISAELVKK